MSTAAQLHAASNGVQQAVDSKQHDTVQYGGGCLDADMSEAACDPSFAASS
jgi:hypothetical protein